MALEFRKTTTRLPWETSSATPYRVRLRDSLRFRVVRVAQDDWDDPVRCFLIQRELSAPADGGPYKALSYVWGSPRLTDTIYIDGLSVQLTLNLFCALKYLRHTNIPGEDLIVWVDALCINQQDPDERGSQVQLMKDIYQNAAEVIVFIGDGRGHRISHSDLKLPPPSEVTRLMGDSRDQTLCQSILKVWRSTDIREMLSPAQSAGITVGLVRLLSDGDNLRQVCEDLMKLETKIRSHIFECLRLFLVTPWWSRIWVVQEIAVSTAATVHYGTISAPWPVLVRAAKAISESSNVFTNIEPENFKVLALLATQVSNIERTRSWWHEHGGIDLVRLLQEFSNRQASDDRDKVYGILSLACPGHHIEPNYHIDILETYRITALSLLKSDTGLNCWVGDQKRKNHKDLPSWIPDWSTAFDPTDLRRMTMSKKRAADAVWKLHVVDDEKDYWRLVADQARQLLDCLLGRPPRRVPLLLQDRIKQFIDELGLFWYRRSGFYPSQVLVDGQLPHGPHPWDVPAIPLVTKLTAEHMLGIISTCEQLLHLCARADPGSYEIESFSLFRHSYSFCGNASWMIPIQQRGPQLIEQYAVGREPDKIREMLDPKGFIVQSVIIEPVKVVDARMLGWSLHILSDWCLHLNIGSGPLAGARLDLLARVLLGDDDAQAESLPEMIKWLSKFDRAIPKWSEEPPSTLLDAMKLATDGRVFFTTKQGGMGLGPASMRSGDEIHALPGGTSHFVLRFATNFGTCTDLGLLKDPWSERPKCYELIGNCHLVRYIETPLCAVRGNITLEDDPSFLEGSLPYEILGVKNFGFVVGAAAPGCLLDSRDIRTILLV